MLKGSGKFGTASSIVDNARWHSLPLGISSFENVLKDHAYVDKTLAIADLITRGGTTLLCRPRLFGKTLFISMLQCFFEKSVESFVSERRHLFAGLAISTLGERFTRHCGIHPVIRLGLAGIQSPTWNGVLTLLRSRIASEYERHRYVLGVNAMSEIAEKRYRRIMAQQESDSETVDSLKQLARILHEYHGERAIILIDDCDAILSQETAQTDELASREFVRAWLRSALDGSSSIMFAMLTCTQPPQRGTDDPLPPSVIIDTPLHTYLGTALGFTIPEAKELASHAGKRECLAEAKHWYKGYTIGTTQVLCPWSFLSYLREGVAQPYWTCTDANSLVRTLVWDADETTEPDLRTLAEGSSIKHTLDPFSHQQYSDAPSSAMLWTQLYLAGYLTTDDTQMPTETSLERRLRIPNLEIARLYQREMLLRATRTAGSPERLHAIQHAFSKADCTTLERELGVAIRGWTFCADRTRRAAYRHHILIMLYGIKGYQLPEFLPTRADERSGILVCPDDDHANRLPTLAIEVHHLHHGENTTRSLKELRKHAQSVSLPQACGYQHEQTSQCSGIITWGISFSKRQIACACHWEL